ncbi:hypothetical protein PV10_08900 [Exophiala mesophila]|uniref:Uncharacterized protein n=1 Tax=Exophiala mesophila TaxID=212818 RepID=A0A0D1ZRA9_EXOME|nr:uncharacterized protein PV10_08900 [Exophiala mesophila]KIV89323.1 hypothetical protein PV10_08900 [Exophiala mesophila]
MSANAAALEVLLSPVPNYRNVPTISICSHEIPLPAYWRISELLTAGESPDTIVTLILQHSGVRTRKVVETIVQNIADNQKSMEIPVRSKRAFRENERELEADRGRGRGPVNRISLFLGKKPKASDRASTYSIPSAPAKTALQLQKERERNAKAVTDARLQKADQEEKTLLTTAMNLASRRDSLLKERRENHEDAADDQLQRDKTMAAIDLEMQKTLQRHAEVEMEKEFVKRMMHLIGNDVEARV